MAKRQPISSNHPLVGTWETEEQDSSAVFTVSVTEGYFVVTGKDEMDNEAFHIDDIRWDGEALRFTSVMPSTGHRATHAFRMRADGTVSHELTLIEIWKKR